MNVSLYVSVYHFIYLTNKMIFAYHSDYLSVHLSANLYVYLYKLKICGFISMYLRI